MNRDRRENDPLAIPNFLNLKHPDCWRSGVMNSAGVREVQLRELRAKAAKAASALPAAIAAPPAVNAETSQETDMKTNVKTKPKAAKAAPKQQPKPTGEKSAAANVRTPAGRPGSKLEAIVALLKRPDGCTTADILKVTGWPSVSVPQQARAAGLTLIKSKDGSVTRYRAK
jgi:Protein of unknown function (DUF3489)